MLLKQAISKTKENGKIDMVMTEKRSGYRARQKKQSRNNMTKHENACQAVLTEILLTSRRRLNWQW